MRPGGITWTHRASCNRQPPCARMRTDGTASGAICSHSALGAFLGEMVEVLPDVRRLGRCVGKRDRLVEGGARLGAPAELLQERALDAVEVEVARQPVGQ